MAPRTRVHRPPGMPAAVAARFSGMAQARHALEALENAGVDGDDLALIGDPVEVARLPHDPGRTDRRTAVHIAKHVGVGIAIGAGGGAALGLLVGLTAAAVTDPSNRVGYVVALFIVGLGLGGTLGAFISFERSVGLSDDWPLTFEDAPAGSVWVAVYSREERTVGRAMEELTRLRPLELRRDS